MVRVEINGAERLPVALRRYSAAYGLTLHDAMLEHAATVGRKLAQFTEPAGLGGKAQKRGESAVSVDIARTYKCAGTVARKIRMRNPRAAAAFVSAMRSAKFGKAARIAERSLANPYDAKASFDGGADHRRRRNRRGRVVKGSKTDALGECSAMFSYRGRKRLRVGFGKGGWANALKTLPRPRGATQRKRRADAGIRKWITRHGAPGRSVVRGRGGSTEIVMKNGVSYIRNILRAARVRSALRSGVRASIKRMQIRMHRDGKRLGFDPI